MRDPRRTPAALPTRRGCPSWLLAAAALLVAACGGDRGRDPDLLVAAISTDPGQLNPAITTNGSTHMAADLLYDGLLSLDDELQPQPALAREWWVEDDGATYRFRLRSDVRWHDGVPFTAADVKFSFDEVLLQHHARTRASLGPALSGIETPDDSTVVFRFRRPYAPLLQQLDVVEAPIVARHIYEGSDPRTNAANQAPVGTGPYRFVSRAPDAEIRYAANPEYWGGAPPVERVILRVIPDPAMQLLALEAGEVDWLFGVPGPERARLKSNPDVGFLETSVNPGGSNCILSVSFNLDRPVLSDARVRRAIWHAVDRDQFVERILFGEGRVAAAPISSGIPFAHAPGLSLPPYDTAAAARLLDAAGWRRGGDGARRARGVRGVVDGTPLALGFTEFPTYIPYGELLRAQLRVVGIDLTPVPLEPPVFVDAVFTRREFDTAIVSYCNGTDPEIGVRRMYDSANIAPVPFSNASGYRNPSVDQLFDRASGLLDPEARRAVYREIQEIVVRDLPYLWLVESLATRAYSNRCENFGQAAHFAATARCGP